MGELNSPIPVHFSLLIPKMLVFTLAISCISVLGSLSRIVVGKIIESSSSINEPSLKMLYPQTKIDYFYR